MAYDKEFFEEYFGVADEAELAEMMRAFEEAHPEYLAAIRAAYEAHAAAASDWPNPIQGVTRLLPTKDGAPVIDPGDGWVWIKRDDRLE